MKTRQALRYLVVFTAGALLAVLVGAGLFLTPNAGADPACISTAAYMTGNIGTMEQNTDGTFSLIYQVPSCILSGGYHIENVSKFNSNSIKIIYKK